MLRCHGNLLIKEKNIKDDRRSIYVKQANQLFQKMVRLSLLQLKLEIIFFILDIKIEREIVFTFHSLYYSRYTYI